MSDGKQAFWHGSLIKSLYHCVRNSTSIDRIPGLLKQIIREEMWREHFHEPTQQTYHCASFQEFIESAPPQGVGVKLDTLWQLCRDDPEAQDLIDQATQRKAGAKDGNQYARKDKKTILYNIQNSFDVPTGTSKQAGLRKLRKHAAANPEVNELYAKVLEGQMSVNRALIKAKLRASTLTIPSDLQKAAKTLQKHFTPEEIQDLIFYLQE